MNLSSITLPVIPLRGITIFPNMIIHFDVGREKSIKALEEAMEENGEIFLVAQIDPEVEEPTKDNIYDIGTICKVKQIVKMPKNITRVLVEGMSRGRIEELILTEEVMNASVISIKNEEDCVEIDKAAYLNLLINSFSEYVLVTEGDDSKVISLLKKEEDLSKLADLVASYMHLEEEKKQQILETVDLLKRIEKVLVYLNEEIEIAELESKIGIKVKDKVDKSNKEYYLREQLKAIQEELGEDEDKNEVDKYESKIKKMKMPKKVREKAESELAKLKNAYSSDNNNVKTYLDWILDLPWDKSSKTEFSMAKASEILDNEHFGISDVKERILEYLAVKEYTKSSKSPVLCLVGPPGVGKSTIGKSISNALNRKFVRISLGGIRDEAEIRGHRRTYVGAIPGRLVYALKEAGVNNPVILLDEIDKLSADYKGNPADALLEVLDPKQNKAFRDSYLEVDLDLSKAIFITTANSLDTIPSPLLDRMEVIEVSGYTYEEKYHIAKKHLIPKSIIEHNLSSDAIKISDGTIKEIVNSYTRESGVRGLERQINKVIRKAITEIYEEKKEVVNISANKINRYLGEKLFYYDKKESEDRVGVVTGLAWTAYGGDTLPVEVVIMNGNGKLELTGQLGSVMQESAKAAYSYVRANAKKYGIEEEFYKTKDTHIHVPEGAVPKDGPSAGVTMVTALVSALTNNKIKSSVAMTGEVTLTGRVLAIGGVKEKCLAAHRMGIDTIILPKENKKHVDKIPANIKGKLKFIFADVVDDVVNNALIGVD